MHEAFISSILQESIGIYRYVINPKMDVATADSNFNPTHCQRAMQTHAALCCGSEAVHGTGVYCCVLGQCRLSEVNTAKVKGIFL